MTGKTQTSEDSDGGPPRERIAKRLARAGIASRREAERLIAEGRVEIDGIIIDTPAIKVGDDQVIRVDGEQIGGAQPVRLWLYHKPPGLMTTRRDPQGRATIFDNLPQELPYTVSIGRLDLNSEGLLLLSTSGALARYLELPATGWTRRYRARVFGRPDAAAIARLAEGVEVDGEAFGPIHLVIDDGKNSGPAGREKGPSRTSGANSWVTVSLKEGRNREVRRALQAVGHSVSRLIRTAYGPFQLGQLPRGATKEAHRRVLREALGAERLTEIEAGRTPDPGRQTPGKPNAGKPNAGKPNAGKPAPGKPAAGKPKSGKAGPKKSGPKKSGANKPAPGKPAA